MPAVFGSLGVPEILFLMVLALLIFGPKRLPEIGRTLGKGLSEFRRASSELKRSFDSEMSAIERAADPTPKDTKPAVSSRFAGLAAPADAVERGAEVTSQPPVAADPVRPE